MSKDIKITYVNNSMNKDMPKIFVFTQNELPSFNAIRDGIAWKVISDIERNSRSTFIFPSQTKIMATWNGGTNETPLLQSEIGNSYTVNENDKNIVLAKNGNASHTKSIDINNNANIQGGVQASLYKDGKLMMSKNIVSHGQKATFVLKPRLYWGIASEIEESQLLNSAVLNTDHFFEQDLEGVSEVEISLNGNAEDGYYFKIDSQK